MGKLEIHLLGTLSVTAENAAAFPLSRKNMAVLAALALAGPGGLSREKLVDLFWRDRGEKQARASLRQALAATRKGLGRYRDCLRTDADRITVACEAIEVDARKFEALAASNSIADQDRALALYQGDLLDGVRLPEDGFETWLRPTRERLRATAVALLSERIETKYEADRSIALASRLLELDLTNEAAHRALMRAYAAQGRDTAAVRQFNDCRDILGRDLGIEPSRETIALFEDIRRKRRRPVKSDMGQVTEKEVDKPLAPTDRPSIAVLPFDNMSDDPGQEYFSDGITQDVTTALSRFRSLFVIARNSAFTYKGSAFDITQIARDLDVRYVVEGSVRKAGQRVRISAQLIDGATGNHLWADHFDGALDDVFNLQDQIAERIVIVVEPEIQAHERRRARRKPPENLDAWECLQRGLWHFHRVNKADRAQAIHLFRGAVALDPEFASAHAHLAFALWTTAQFGYTEDKAYVIASAQAAADQAVLLDPLDPLAHVALGRLHIVAGEIEMAIDEMQTAVAINPNYSGARFGLGHAYHYGAGEAELALAHYNAALRLSPRSPMRSMTLMVKGSALRALGRHHEAIAHCRQAARIPNAGFLPHMHLAAALAEAGQSHEAKKAVKRATGLEHRLSCAFIRNHFAGMHAKTLKSLLDSLRKAGVPE